MSLRFPGQYFDKESNLHYNTYRTYQPAQGRYTQNDPIGLAGGWNRFAYVDGDAISLTDPYGLDNPGMGPYGPGPNNYGRDASNHWQRSAAVADFVRNFNNMRDANTKRSDLYFHCKANCEETRRGRYGEALACDLSDARELWDQYGYKLDSAADSRRDQAAKAYGRSGALSSRQSCSAVCNIYRPNGLPADY
jgi:RHS repeat-associated protein